MIPCRVPDEPGHLHQHGPSCGMGACLQSGPLPTDVPEETRPSSCSSLTVAADGLPGLPAFFISSLKDLTGILLINEKLNVDVLQ